MAEHRTEGMADGILNVYKEKGFTSHDVVAKLRGILHMKKIGHTGTLDPDAEGVLPVCLGKGTRLCELLTDKDKEYEALLKLGVETDTQDTSGRTLAEHPVLTSPEQLVAVIGTFVGEIEQIPPMYSAIKVNGKKLYELARAGKEVERQARRIRIYGIDILGIDLPFARIRVRCSKGTYIRTLCHDIGQAAGCGGCMAELIRTRSGRFLLEDSLTLSGIETLYREGSLQEHILPVDAFFSELSKIALPENLDRLAHNGNALPYTGCRADIAWNKNESGQKREAASAKQGFCENLPASEVQRYRVYDSAGRFIGVYEMDRRNPVLKPWKMFYSSPY